jgi:hypothetical protein
LRFAGTTVLLAFFSFSSCTCIPHPRVDPV